MKKLLYLLSATLIVACNNSKKADVDYGVFSGKIENAKISELQLSTQDGSVDKTIKINADGTFLDTILDTRQIYALYNKASNSALRLNVQPGEHLNITIKGNDLGKDVTFSGDGAANHIYLAEKAKKMPNLQQIYTLNEKDFLKALDSIDSNSKDNLIKSNVSDKFKERELRMLNYWKLSTISQYEYAHKALTQDPNFTPSDDFKKLTNIEQIDLNNFEDLQISDSYKRLIFSHYTTKAEELSKTNKKDFNLSFLDAISGIRNPDVKNYLAYNFTSRSIGYANDVESLYKAYLAASNNEGNNAKITEIYNSLKALAKGAPSPTFSNYTNAKGGTTSLADLKGKYVYIDVWATWCGPCKQEIPFLKEIEKQFHNKNIEFVSISVDEQSNIEGWKKMVADQKLGGVQLIAENAFASQFVKAYQITAIPQFILLDPNGNIVEKNAPRPSNPALKELFKTLSL